MGWLRTIREWGSTPEERARPFPCDEALPGYDHAYYRAVDVDAEPAIVYRWFCQLRVAPYSYDWIDNWGRRSPRTLTPGLEALEVDQIFMKIFRLVSFEPDRHVTVKLRRGVRMPPTVVSYLVVPRDGGCRLLVKLVARTSSRLSAFLLGSIGAAGDWFMMRRQLLNLRDLAERDQAAREAADTGSLY